MLRGVIVWAPLASGFLTDGFSVERLQEDDFRRGTASLSSSSSPFALHCTALHGGRRTGALGAIAFVLAHSAVTGAIVGVWNEREAAELAQGAELRLTPDEVAAIASAA